MGIFTPLSKISKDPDDRKTTAKSSTVRSSSPIRSQKIDLFHVTFKINAGASSIKKHLAKKPPANPPVVDTPPTTQPGSVSLPGSSSSSPSSSTSSLDNKPQPSPWQRLVHPWPRNPVCTKRPSVVKTAPPCANTTASIASLFHCCNPPADSGETKMSTCPQKHALSFHSAGLPCSYYTFKATTPEDHAAAGARPLYRGHWFTVS
ncbi:CAP-Gly domain-containing linker protein 4-like [Polyodon spathula]|uniref:CAP-Gly domain-containing linker protein 4-like n=1 Tax=Polyodon spathula TaxID=7913 RepID=UPI001B7EA3F9|nr:CAP-Gly domain-containing linker protein 4-like [Polyodon spathula]